MNTGASDRHLTDAELFDLAAPASGEPEPLPRHLSQCDACSRALQEWKAAMRELAMEDAAPLDRRPAEEWLATRSLREE
jgi:anti-sigma factor RsiW